MVFHKGSAYMKFDIHYLFSAKYAKWIILSLISLFSLLILYTYAKLFIPNASPPKLSNADAGLQSKAKQESFDSLMNSSLFGVYIPKDINGNSVKKSQLNVTIVGILFGNKAERSQVILRSASGDEKNYRVGDKIPGGAVIKRILAGGILVEYNGGLESLSLPKNDLIFEPVAKPLKEE